MRNKKISTSLLLVILCVFGFMSVVYAMYTTTLNIVGTATTGNSRWEIKFANLSSPVITGSPTVINAPTISDTYIGDFRIGFNKPTDSVSYEFDIQNNGDFDVIISTLYKTIPICTGLGDDKLADESLICGNLVFTFKYKANGLDVSEGDLLNSGESKRVILTIAYMGNGLPREKVEITGLNISLIYEENN